MAPRSSKSAVVLCLFQSMAGLLFGWEQSSTAGLYVLDSFNQRFGSCTVTAADGSCTTYALTTTQQSTIAGILSIGAFLGALASGALSGKFGLRMTCIAFIAIFMVGIGIETSATQTWGQICVGRALTGMGIGATSGLVPVFQAEAAPPALRGLITGSFQLCVTLGILLVNCATYGMSMHPSEGDTTWRLPVGIQLLWAFLLLLGFVASPESPRFLAGKNRWEEARKSLARLRSLPEDDQEIDVEIEEIRIALAEEEERGVAKYSECFSMKDMILFRTLIGLMVQIGQQLTGVNFFFSYGSIFASDAGISNPFIFQIILASVNVAMSFPGLWAVDNLGRRTVLLSGAAAMFAGQIIVGAVSIAVPSSAETGKVLIAFCCLFVAGFASTWGPVAWVVSGEVFPIRLASKLTSLSVAGNWGMNTIIAFVSPIVQDKIGTAITFVWAGFLAWDFIFTFLCVPETSGMSIEEIDALFLSRTPAWRSKKFIRAQQDEEDEGAEKRGRASEHREKAEEPVKNVSARTSEEVESSNVSRI